MLAVVKLAGMIVNRADTSKHLITLQDVVEETYHISETVNMDQEKFVIEGYNKFDEFISRSGIVHRLDKETSGIILVAKNIQSFISLQNQFKKSLVEKTYLALVHGRLEEKEGEIDAPILRLPWNRMRFGVHTEGRTSKTLYSVVEYRKLPSSEVASLIEVYPQTGRTHQIRVHFQHIKHPIFGDELYVGRKAARDDRKLLNRHFLHASKISFLHPEAGNRMVLESPLPEELTNFLESLPVAP